MSIVIHMEPDDFEHLLKTSYGRAAMTIYPGRFDSPGGEVNADWDWSVIYWLGHDYAAVIFARAFLAAYGYRYEVLWDTSAQMDQPPRGWCILTDYDLRQVPVPARPDRG